MKRRLVIPSIPVVAAIFLGGCAPNFYEGQVAIVTPSPEISTTQRLDDWGDCHRRWGDIPTVYLLKRPNYELMIAHGDRYWPEFYLLARDDSGRELVVTGPDIEPIKYKSGGDIQRLSKGRGFVPSYKTASNAPQSPLSVAIANESGAQLGQERVAFSVESTRCFGWDAL